MAPYKQVHLWLKEIVHFPFGIGCHAGEDFWAMPHHIKAHKLILAASWPKST